MSIKESLQLGNINNWDLVADESVEAISTGPNELDFQPIPAFELPLLLDNLIVAVQLRSLTARPTWKYGGLIVQRLSLPLPGGLGTATPSEGKRYPLRLNRTLILPFPRLTTSFELVYEPPYWFRDVRLKIWEYTGPDSNEVMQALAVQDSKLDQILINTTPQ